MTFKVLEDEANVVLHFSSITTNIPTTNTFIFILNKSLILLCLTTSDFLMCTVKSDGGAECAQQNHRPKLSF